MNKGMIYSWPDYRPARDWAIHLGMPKRRFVVDQRLAKEAKSIVAPLDFPFGKLSNSGKNDT
jgi:hypothetical protein